MNKGGRPQNKIWDKFIRIDEHSKIKAKCKKCHQIYSNKVSRLKMHYDKCKIENMEKSVKDNNNTNSVNEDVSMI